MGLRERHKTERTTRILDAARVLFRKNGFEQVKAEQIAAMADVSVGTFYNYFGGKNEILLTLSALENERLAGIGALYEVAQTATMKQAFGGLINIYFDPANMMLERDLWRRGFALAFADVMSDEVGRFLASDKALREQVIDLARTMQAQGRLWAGLDCEVFGATLYNNANILFLEFAWSENSTFDELNAQIKKATEAIIDLALPSEAVR